MNSYVLIFIFAVFIASISQILLKKSANRNHKNWLKEILTIKVFIAYSMFLLSSMLIIYAYKGVQLKYGAIIQSSGYIFILLLGRIFLEEKITKNRILGIVLIIIGIVVFKL